MKKGQPKCICAPNCKSPINKVKVKRVGMKNINVIQMQQKTKNLKRQSNLERRHRKASTDEMQDDSPLVVTNYDHRRTNNENQRVSKIFNGSNNSHKNKKPISDSDSINSNISLINNNHDLINIRHKSKKLTDIEHHRHRQNFTNDVNLDENDVEIKFRSGFFNENYFPTRVSIDDVNENSVVSYYN